MIRIVDRTAEGDVLEIEALPGGDKDVAYDATQEAYVVMWKRWRDNKKPEGDVCRYVVGIAVHKVADFYRSRERDRCAPLEDDHDCGSDETGYPEVLDAMTVLPVVRDFLDRQPSQRRAVGVLYFLEEFDYPEIAETLGIARSTEASSHDRPGRRRPRSGATSACRGSPPRLRRRGGIE